MTKSLLKTTVLCSALALGAVSMTGCAPRAGDDKASATPALTVRVTTPQKLSWARQVTANGALAAWQEAVISAETGPLRIASITVDVGSPVRKGQVLATLSPDSLRASQAQLQAQVSQAQINLDKANSDTVRGLTRLGDPGSMLVHGWL